MKKDYNNNAIPMADTSFNVHETILSMVGKSGGYDCINQGVYTALTNITKQVVSQQAVPLPKGRRKVSGMALDLGAGFGLLSGRLREYGYDVTACELDPARISHIREMGIRCDRVDLDTTLPYRSGAFDLVVASDVIEHLRSPFAAIAEMGRVTRKGGSVIVSTPNIMNWYSRMKFLFSGVYNNYFTEKEFQGEGYHISPLHYCQLKWGMEQAGLNIVELRANQYSGILNFSSLKIMASSMASMPLRVFMKPKSKPLMEGDIIIVKAKKVR